MDNIIFKPEDHTYWCEGKELISISALIKHFGLTNYDGIPKEILDNASERGTDLHACVSFYLDQTLDENSVHDDYLSRWKGFKKFAQAHTLETIAQNEIVGSKSLGVAGTLDWRGKLDGRHTIIDWKFTNALQKSVRVQLAGYKFLYNLKVQPEDQVEDVLAVQIIPGTYKLPPSDFHEPDDEIRFFHLVDVMNLQKEIGGR